VLLLAGVPVEVVNEEGAPRREILRRTLSEALCKFCNFRGPKLTLLGSLERVIGTDSVVQMVDKRASQPHVEEDA